jgi:hypothetical protein
VSGCLCGVVVSFWQRDEKKAKKMSWQSFSCFFGKMSETLGITGRSLESYETEQLVSLAVEALKNLI